MKLSSVFVSSILCLNMVAAKKHGLRRVLRNQRNLADTVFSYTCDDFYNDLDTNGDGTVTFEEAAGVYISWGADESEIEYILAPYGPGDSISKADAIEECENYDTIFKSKKSLFAAAEKIQKIQLVHKKKAAEKDNFWKKAATKHNLDDTDDAVFTYTCQDFFDDLDTNGDGAVTYEEAAGVYISWGADESDIEYVLAPYGPGDSISEADFIEECESTDAKKKNKKGLLAAAELSRAHEKTEKKKVMDHEMTIHTYSEVEVNECKGFFNMMDLDKNGELSVDDLEGIIDSKVKAHVNKAEIRQFVEDIGEADLNNDKIISKKEFMSACLND